MALAVAGHGDGAPPRSEHGARQHGGHPMARLGEEVRALTVSGDTWPLGSALMVWARAGTFSWPLLRHLAMLI